MATKKGSAFARKVDGAGRAPASRSAVGDEITSHLRALQAQRAEDVDLDAVLSALVPAIAALARRGVLVSVARTPDARSVRLSALMDGEWVPWYVPDADEASLLADGIIMALGT